MRAGFRWHNSQALNERPAFGPQRPVKIGIGPRHSGESRNPAVYIIHARKAGMPSIVYIKLLYFSGQGIAAPAEQSGRVLTAAAGFLEGLFNQDRLEAGHGVF